MIVGSTTAFSSILTNITAFTVLSSSGSLLCPDNTTVVITPVVDSPASIQSHVITSLVPFAILGKYIYTLTVNMSDGQIKVSKTEFFASYIDANAIVRERLQIDPTIIPDIVIDRGIRTTYDILQSRYIPDYVLSYALIPDADKRDFDTAMALLTASMMRGFLPKTTPVGDLLSNKIGPDEFKYADINAHAKRPLETLEQQWIAEAQTLLDDLSFISDAVNNDAQMELFVLTGPRRHSRMKLSVPDSTPDYNIWGDVNTRYMWSRNFVTAGI